VSIEVAPSALSFFKVASRWCSITLRFLKYVTYSPVRTVPSSVPPRALAGSEDHCTHPTARACAFKFSELRRANLFCLLVFPYAVDDAVAVQTLEETVAAVPALCASCAVGCYEAAIFGCCGWRRCRWCGRAAEPAHCEDVCVEVFGVLRDDSLVGLELLRLEARIVVDDLMQVPRS
jgi:hypothetical protein